MLTLKSILVILILLLFGCGKDKSNPNSSQSGTSYHYWYPLSVGNFWVYQKQTSISPPQYIIDTIRIVGKYLNDKDSIYAFKGGDKYSAFYQTYFGLRKDAEGLFYRYDSLYTIIKNNSGIFVKGLLLSPNVNVNQIDSINCVYCDEPCRLKVYSIDEVITVPAGVFTCIHLIFYYCGSGGYNLWISKDFGVIRTTFGTGNLDKLELVSYKLD